LSAGSSGTYVGEGYAFFIRIDAISGAKYCGIEVPPAESSAGTNQGEEALFRLSDGHSGRHSPYQITLANALLIRRIK
jgi:hypothetical protein